jgi:autophagy-related protein 9
MFSSTMQQSGIGGMAMAQTVVLGDSQGSDVLEAVSRRHEAIPEEDLLPEVGSGLGESYVDGKPIKANMQAGEDEDEQLNDVGVLGLLAQIYDGRGGL